MTGGVLQRYIDRVQSLRSRDKITDSGGKVDTADAFTAPVPPSGTPPKASSPFRRADRAGHAYGVRQPQPDAEAGPHLAAVPTSAKRALDFGRSSRLAGSFAPAFTGPSGSPARPASSPQRGGLIAAEPAPQRFARALSHGRSPQIPVSSPHRLVGAPLMAPPAAVLQSVPRPGHPTPAQPVASFRHRRYSIASSQLPQGRREAPTQPPHDAPPSARAATAPAQSAAPEHAQAHRTQPQRPTAARPVSPPRQQIAGHALASTSSMSGSISALPVSARAFATSTSLNASSRLASMDSAMAAALPRPHATPGDVRMQCADAALESGRLEKARRTSADEAPCLARLLSDGAGENHAAASNSAGEGAELDSLAGYSIGDVIGEGGFCQVKLGTHQLSGRSVAVKVINKRAVKTPFDWKRVGREIRILKRLQNHPAIIHMLDVVSRAGEVYVVQELAQGGSLLDFVRSRKRIPEDTALRFFLQIVAGLQFCHDKDVVHRDIKLENLLLDGEHNMKIIDFGLAAVLTPGGRLRVHCGSPSYAAPEIVGRQSYVGPPVDVWSLGIVTFAMVCGHLPFYSRNGRTELSQKILAGKYHSPDCMSPMLKDLVSSMLVLDPARRATLPQIWTHPWVTGSLTALSFRLPCPLLPRDAATGGYVYEARIVQHMAELGIPSGALRSSLACGECNKVTATYFLLAEGLRASAAPPAIGPQCRDLGRRLARWHAMGAKSEHGFSLDEYEDGDRDDGAFFAPPRHRGAV